MDSGASVGSGTYTISLNGSNLNVQCDMVNAGGGWTIIQKRISDTDFYKTWVEYKNGFGNTSNFWLGNDNISNLTSSNKELYVYMTYNSETAYAKYSNFKIGDYSTNYRLTISGYLGTAGDSMAYHNGYQFTTKNVDNDIYDTANCAEEYLGAWWYGRCHYSNLNGDWGNINYADSSVWYPCKGHYTPLTKTIMMIR